MSGFELALLIGLIVAAAVSWRDGRALTWLAAGTANYLITSAYYDLGLPHHPAFTFMVDGLLAATIIVMWRERWEAILAWIFTLSAVFDLFRYFEYIDGYAYATALEVANWAALATIGGPHIVELIGRLLDPRGAVGGFAHRAHLVLTAARQGETREKA